MWLIEWYSVRNLHTFIDIYRYGTIRYSFFEVGTSSCPEASRAEYGIIKCHFISIIFNRVNNKSIYTPITGRGREPAPPYGRSPLETDVFAVKVPV